MNDYYSLLEVRREANPSEISVAYRRILKDKFQKSGYNDQVSEVTKAYRVLSSPDKRKEYDLLLQKVAGKYILQNPKNPTPADKKYLAGINAMDRKNFQVAVDYFKQSIKLDPEKTHFYSHLGLALGMFTGKLAEAERYCKKAIELEADNPELCYNLGFLYQRHNLVEAAQQAFLQAQEAEQKRWDIFFKKDNSPIEALWYGEKAEEGITEAKTTEESEIKKIPAQPEEQQASPPDEKGNIIQKEEPVKLTKRKIAKQEKDQEAGMFSDQIVMAEIIDGDSDKTLDEVPSLSMKPADKPVLKSAETASAARKDELEAQPLGKSIDTEKDSLSKIVQDEMEPMASDAKTQTSGEQQSPPFMENISSQEEALLSAKGHSEADALENLVPVDAEFSANGSSSGISTGDERLLMEISPQQKTVSAEALSSAYPETADEEKPWLEGGEPHSESQTLEELENEALNLLRELGLSPSDQIDSIDNPETNLATAEEEKNKGNDSIQEQDENSVAELKRLEEMEKKMAEDLMRLKKEREKLKKKIGV